MQKQNDSPSHQPQDIYDLSGQSFGPITVVSLDHIIKGRRYWLVRCICETERVLPAHRFRDKVPPCSKCDSKALAASGKATPDWLQALGFNETFYIRFWPNVDKNGPPPAHRPELGPCWIWTAGVNGKGYGSISAQTVNGRTRLISTHRASWIIHTKKLIPEEMGEVLHHCDTPRCLRPDHLFLGDTQTNSDDMISKGRDFHPVGEAHHNAKLTDEKVIQIRKKYAPGRYTYADLAKEFECSQTLIAVIVRGEAWRHI